MFHNNFSLKTLPFTLSLRPGYLHEGDKIFLLGVSALVQ